MIHDTYNPYTAVQRSPSQWFIFVPSSAPLDNTTIITLSHDAVNLASIPPTDSAESLQSRYVVPEVIPFKSSSEVDTRSAGNPYSHHPNFTTPSQYFEHIMDSEGEQHKMENKNEENLLTIMDIKNLKDPFGNYDMDGEQAPMVSINPPNDVTVNKNAFSSDSIADIQNMNISFPIKAFTAPAIPSTSPDGTLNKKMLSPESMYELEQTDGEFELKEMLTNSLVLRDYSPESLAELRNMRNLSQYTDFNSGSSKDVATGIGISPSPYERQQFEWTENVAYGGI
ncbi:Ovule protein [Caenorhabditis elegans]|uniref:Ovule protein n=1 Tax=Caenorhabditis elegans TaxID=6239 RepID=Q17451_CAEEL|nr:Ovule protein [Caenorhabditis elegans]CCD61389.2 Ovule protein [Caenorhabditis elegans]|eukprot:NP_501370.2 Uncharacterized protein CELE_B0218.7 [Caenorhabditis elegans]